MTGITGTVNNTAWYAQSWSYNNLNQVASYVNGRDGITDYTYDADHQLTSSDVRSQSANTYQYDTNGNRIDSTTEGTTTLGPDNQLASDGRYTYTYDNGTGGEGDLTSRYDTQTGTTLTFTYDNRNRLTEIDSSGTLTPSNFTVKYAYDVFDRRISTTTTTSADGGEGGSTVYTTTKEAYVYDGDHVVLDFLSTATGSSPNNTLSLEHRYLYGPAVDQVLAQENLGESSLTAADRVDWLLTDNEGTVRDVIDNAGGWVTHYTYDAYGNRLTGDTSVTRYLYAGREFDPNTGLEYNQGAGTARRWAGS